MAKKKKKQIQEIEPQKSPFIVLSKSELEQWLVKKTRYPYRVTDLGIEDDDDKVLISAVSTAEQMGYLKSVFSNIFKIS